MEGQVIGSKADYRRDDFIMARQTRTPWIPLEHARPMTPLWPYFALGAAVIAIVALLAK